MFMIDVKELVMASLTKEDMPLNTIAKKCNLSLATASKYCHILEAEGKAEIKKFGNMKMVRLR